MNTPAMAQIAGGVARAEVTSAFPKYRQIIDALSYQSIQIPAGHRPIELEAAPITARIGR
jgi:hypothetical protein